MGRPSCLLAALVAALLWWPWQTQAAAGGADFLVVTNANRADSRVAPLSISSALNTAAAAKLADMFAADYWAHTSPDGRQPWDFITAAGYHWVASAENLAEGYTAPAAVVAAWMASPGHRANMLNANYRDVGFAIGSGQLGGKTVTLAVAMYGSIVYGATAPLTTPTVAPVAKPKINTKTTPHGVSAANAPIVSPLPLSAMQGSIDTSAFGLGIMSEIPPATPPLAPLSWLAGLITGYCYMFAFARRLRFD